MAAYDVNYDDERFTQVEADKQEALTDLEKTYGGMIDKSDKFYQDQINASKEWADTQVDIQNQNTEFAIEKIEQQKEQAQKDYIKEQSGAYADWRKQSNEYGAESEKMASAGLQGTGFSESSQVSMYNTYQNRVAMARDSINRAMLNFDNGINEARLQNNSAIAEIKFKALQEQLSLSLQGFQYKNQLIDTLASKKTDIDQIYYNRYQDVLAQINHENAMAEQIRQYNASRSSGVGNNGAVIENGLITKSTTASELGSALGRLAGTGTAESTQKTSALEYLRKLMASGASKEKVMNEINEARSQGAITQAEALSLFNIFNQRGMLY